MHTPDYCSNILFVYGSLEELNAFRKKAEGVNFWDNNVWNAFCLDKFIPVPQGLDMKETLEWQYKNWGVERGILRASLTPRWDLNELDYAITTHREPPIKAYKEISRRHPNLTFDLTYEAPSLGSAGSMIIQNGQERKRG